MGSSTFPISSSASFWISKVIDYLPALFANTTIYGILHGKYQRATIWSDVYRCEGFVTSEEPTGKISTRGKNVGKPSVRKKRVARGCGREIVLWDAAVDHATGEVIDEF